ncbi:MAG: Recombination protein RecR [Candidatus Nomurabacteria bacterium GW2011_GWE1_32_28]|uniref:Recombination protein RecR n=1 Tax=Candidatus Nomurabacteria bacterium GW2011_GWF1_31_48 TaxID=1618767 RepID=A0A0F9YH08_9BACT|nr:MAG: Recombination protein RecR [Candidatus Nomurabacteria bacterium GW2011_GWF2_30_133]KKP28945.1 MAG: Recombination protein RecR [Candidatus Nomurabacteria bacterium GW2011_GWE2_31_40]KKP30683.1 MAG: Recombination protein RecR [Candidatus Nomurabacteria bacterium GW2011_GWF1_31_48]KKP35201.1 MAG: Recombination protein RecR [Candidatus Nomurabacteria bacterium GW2011_GWE1_32_28]HAS80511.1 recombination protein RecR [Candidatus Nomurabacteria bacterium]
MNTIEKLTEIFKEFPGIGERQAKRFVYFLMSRNGSYGDILADSIKNLKKEVSQCPECFKFFLLENKKNTKCEICIDENKDISSLMILEKDSDLESIHKSKVYNGKYFILGGLVPIVEKNTNSKIRMKELIKKIETQKNKLKEIVLAFSSTPQGNHTDFYLRNQLKEIIEPLNIKISSLGKGLSTGTELEYSDNDTLKNALKNRQ